MCERATIPILPVRFSLLPYDLDNVVKPTSIDNPGSYPVRTLRRGFVYIYVEDPREDGAPTDNQGHGNWHIFRFDTNSRDVNGTYVPENSDGYIRADFKFSKYLWAGATADSKWVFFHTHVKNMETSYVRPATSYRWWERSLLGREKLLEDIHERAAKWMAQQV
ncbi:toxin VasX [Thalassospira sp.]|uniref:toxin VasX n=1 Tax=Thalassospira sp. TaxID=1912094 RepID=UPI003AA8A6FB